MQGSGYALRFKWPMHTSFISWQGPHEGPSWSVRHVTSFWARSWVWLLQNFEPLCTEPTLQIATLGQQFWRWACIMMIIYPQSDYQAVQVKLWLLIDAIRLRGDIACIKIHFLPRWFELEPTQAPSKFVGAPEGENVHLSKLDGVVAFSNMTKRWFTVAWQGPDTWLAQQGVITSCNLLENARYNLHDWIRRTWRSNASTSRWTVIRSCHESWSASTHETSERGLSLIVWAAFDKYAARRWFQDPSWTFLLEGAP